VLTGIATEFGVESSARYAFNRGFYSVVVSDCVSSPYKDGHERSLEKHEGFNNHYKKRSIMLCLIMTNVTRLTKKLIWESRIFLPFN
jgi:nicotinamidase-related amidase